MTSECLKYGRKFQLPSQKVKLSTYAKHLGSHMSLEHSSKTMIRFASSKALKDGPQVLCVRDTVMTHFAFYLLHRWYWQKQKQKPYVDFMQRNYPPDFKYQDFAPLFTAEFFDAKEWTDIFASSGAKYIVLTTKHHEGTPHFCVSLCLYNTSYSVLFFF